MCGHVAPRNGLHRVCCDCEVEALYANWLRRLRRVEDCCRLWRDLTGRWPYPAFLTGPHLPDDDGGITGEIGKRKDRCPVCGRGLMIPLGQPCKRCPSCGTTVGMRCPVCGQESMAKPATVFGQPYKRRGGKLLRCASCATLVGMWHFGRPRRMAVADRSARLSDDSGPAAYAQQSDHTAMYPDDADAVRWENGMTEHNTAPVNGRPSNLDGPLPSANREKLRQEITYFEQHRRLHPRAIEHFDRRRR